MSYKGLMILGASLTALSILGLAIIPGTGSLVILAVGGAALFGKGYGIYEVRSKPDDV